MTSIMGSFNRGIHGGFSGKVGNVVGAHWRGIDYMRSLPRVSKGRPVTEEQLMHRVRFAAAVAFAKPISHVFNAEIGRTTGRERGLRYDTITMVDGDIKKQKNSKICT